MYLLYLDESGSVGNPNERHFVLAGIAVFERRIYHLICRTDQLVASFGLGAALSTSRESPRNWRIFNHRNESARQATAK